MGLFDRNSKKSAKDETEEKKAETEAKTEAAPAENEPAAQEAARPTRYTFVVENVFEVDANESIAAVGNIHGKINVGDTFFIIHPKFPEPLTAKADALVVGNETKDSAENCRLAIRITDITDPNVIPKYSVISNIEPQTAPEPNRPIENPLLVGLTCEYNHLVKENEFTYTFMVALLTSNYITPAEMQLDAPDRSTGKVKLRDPKVSFRLLHHPNDQSLLVLPIFTDIAALGLWTSALKENEKGEKPKTVLMPFQRCADIGMKNSGVVVNPFGPFPVFVSNQNLQNTLMLRQQALKRKEEMDKAAGNSTK